MMPNKATTEKYTTWLYDLTAKVQLITKHNAIMNDDIKINELWNLN